MEETKLRYCEPIVLTCNEWVLNNSKCATSAWAVTVCFVNSALLQEISEVICISLPGVSAASQ